MSNLSEQFKTHFQQQDFVHAQKSFDQLSPSEKQDIFAELFQKSEFQRTPVMISVLRRVLNKDKTFNDFYESWHPSADMCNKISQHGQVFQQHFPLPVRVMNAINMNNDCDIVSIGITWARNDNEKQQLFDYLKKAQDGEITDNQVRHERIEQVAEGGLLGLFIVKTDENFGTPF